jgi:hypothetical protein
MLRELREMSVQRGFARYWERLKGGTGGAEEP